MRRPKPRPPAAFVTASLAFLFFLFCLGGCGPKPQSADSGALRIVSLAPSLTECLRAIDPALLNSVVGVTRFDEAPEVQGKMRVGGYADPSPEAVLSLSPTLVLAVSLPAMKPRLNDLKKLNLRVETFPLETADEIAESLQNIGRAVGREAEGKRAADEFKKRLKEVRTASRACIDAVGRTLPKAAVIVGRSPVVAAASASYPGQVLELAGAQNALSQAALPYSALSPEALIALKADLIIDAAGAMTDSPEAGVCRELEALFARFSPRPACVRVSDAMLHPGPRMAEAAEELSQKMCAALPQSRSDQAGGGDVP